ncbi:MAG TPA: L-aspartate oxidase [Chromatiales bacterium]|nr:L-aspartate oxidase [Chromatiales bacterium]
MSLPAAPTQRSFDVLVIGSGAAGLTLALSLAPRARVAVLSKDRITEGCTFYAQGGIAAVLDRDDSFEAHVHDTLEAGAGLCDETVVRYAVRRGPECIRWLMELGVDFTRERRVDDGAPLHLTREGGHSHRRVAHVADATGHALETTLVEQARAHENIRLFERHIAIDLITTRKLGSEENRCVGAYVLDRAQRRVHAFSARFVVLATGGASKVYLYTSNPDTSSGDGIAMAWRAGCRVANMEFNQFHPTCLYHPKARTFLISEAVRGEGGVLRLPDGTRFMPRFDPRAELAPRDIVARAIDHEMKRLGLDHVYLDISHRPPEFVRSHFPTIYKRCLELGIDITREPIPVVPAAHYTCGGVLTDLHGRTDLAGLYAAGEVACTGLHGANRLASNSLLECLVFGMSAAEDIERRLDEPAPDIEIPPWDESRVTEPDEMVVVSHNWDELRRFMWDYVGIVRTTKRLQRARRRTALLMEEIDEYYSHFRVTSDLIELRNLVVVADLIIRSALWRKESRGLHYTLDHPRRDPRLDGLPTILVPEPHTAGYAPLTVNRH